jgi:hypothetical protein
MTSLFLGVGLVLAAGATGGAAEEDLAIVKKAVAQTAPAPATPAGEERAAPGVTRAKPQWLRVRVTDKGKSKASVSINLPIGIVEALGDEPLDLCRHRRASKCQLTLRGLLAAFEAGQRLVEIESEDGDVKVWVD